MSKSVTRMSSIPRQNSISVNEMRINMKFANIIRFLCTEKYGWKSVTSWCRKRSFY